MVEPQEPLKKTTAKIRFAAAVIGLFGVIIVGVTHMFGLLKAWDEWKSASPDCAVDSCTPRDSNPPAVRQPSNPYNAHGPTWELYQRGLYEDGWCGDYGYLRRDPDCAGQAQGLTPATPRGRGITPYKYPLSGR